MGQESNSKRHAALDQKKVRSAGRYGRTGQRAPGAPRDTDEFVEGKTAGAFGKNEGADAGGNEPAGQGDAGLPAKDTGPDAIR